MLINQTTAILIVVLILSCISDVLCLRRQDEHDLWTSVFSKSIQSSSQRNASNTAVSLNPRKIDAGYPEWENDLTFSFEQFDDDNKENQAKRAMLGAMDMLQTTMKAMYPVEIQVKQPWPAPTSSKSLERYFFIDNLPQVSEVFKRLLAALGAPGFKELLDCYHAELLTIKVVYGDYFGSDGPPLCKNEPDTSAYSTYEHDDEHEDGVFGVISLCQPFFDHYKDFQDDTILTALASAERIDDGTELNTYDLPCYSSALTFLHELLHWAAMGSSVLGYVIDDQTIWDPRYDAKTKAYRAFYATKMLDGVTYNKDGWTELSNVNNYVYSVQEIYWAARTNRDREWLDPLQIAGYFPVNGPPPPGGA